MRSTITSFFLLSSVILCAQPSQADIYRVLGEINKLRSSGCKCGSKWMPAVGPLKWNEQLHLVSNRYARYMARHDHFDHKSKTGEDLGDRLDDIGYNWLKIGENLGFGYEDFFSVMTAWQDSPSHCRMLMDPDMTEMGLSKHRSYWVQSFSKAPDPLVSVSAH